MCLKKMIDENACMNPAYMGIILEITKIIYRPTSFEDIGLANPGIGPKVHAAIEAVKLLGMPEGRIPLSVVVTEMALSPKSNTAHIALDKAINVVRKGGAGKVPSHIRTNSPQYKYPHDYPKYYVKQQYLPDNLVNTKFYSPHFNKYENGLNKVNEEMKK